MMGSSPPTSTDAVYDLLAIISDPAAAKKRLDELVAEKQAAIDRHAAADAASQKAQSLVTDAQKRHADLDKRESDLNSLSESKTAKFSIQDADLKSRMSAADERERIISAREDAFASVLEAIKVREVNVSNLEKSVSEASGAAQKLKVDLENKHAALRAALTQSEIK